MTSTLAWKVILFAPLSSPLKTLLSLSSQLISKPYQISRVRRAQQIILARCNA